MCEVALVTASPFLTRYPQNESSFVPQCLVTLFTKAAAPYLEFIRKWIYEVLTLPVSYNSCKGKLEDPFGEFFIAQGSTDAAEDYFHNAFTVFLNFLLTSNLVKRIKEICLCRYSYNKVEHKFSLAVYLQVLATGYILFTSPDVLRISGIDKYTNPSSSLILLDAEIKPPSTLR